MDQYDPRSAGEGGELRIRRDMARADRRHQRNRRQALTAGAALAILLVLVAAGTLVRALTVPAAAQTLRAQAPEPLAAVPAADPAVPPASTQPEAVAEVPTAAPTAQEPAPKVRQPASSTTAKPAARRTASSSVQRLRIRIGGSGFEPSRVSATADAPIALTVDRGEGCAAGFSMPSLRINADNSSGPVTVKLGRLKAGTYRFTCSMDMIEGTLVVR